MSRIGWQAMNRRAQPIGEQRSLRLLKNSTTDSARVHVKHYFISHLISDITIIISKTVNQ